jgi:MerR family transcriptional regulator, activator of bmr gene
MKDNLFTIGEISKTKGITIKALRFYERIGVIKPYYTDPVTKYRYYSLEQFLHLDIIRALRSIEISPKEIKWILEKQDTARLLEYLDIQKGKALSQIRLLQKTMKMIDLAQSTIRGAISTISESGIVTKEIPRRYIIKKDIQMPINQKEILVQFSEFPIIIESSDLLDSYETGYASTPDQNNEFRLSYIFNTVALNKKSNKSGLSVIPAGRYICLCFNQQNIQKRQPEINNYLKQNDLKPRLFLQVDLLNDPFTATNHYFEWQVLV